MALIKVEDALNYLRAKLADFRALPNQIVKARQFAATVRNAAIAKGDFAAEDRARKVLDGLLSDLKLTQATQNQLDNLIAQSEAIRSAVGLGQLPALPLVYVAAAIAIAGSVGYLLKSYQARTAEIDLVARGIMTPEEYLKAKQAEATAGEWLTMLPRYLAYGLAAVAGIYVISALPRPKRA